MNKATKIWLILAACLVTVGLLVFTGAMAVLDFDFNKLSTAKYETNTYEINGDFNRISIDADTTEIEFALSDDGECRIDCFETEKVKHSAVVQEGTLVIDTVDTRKWYDYIGIFPGTPKMTVYLPQNEYTSLLINISTGDIEIPDDFIFESINVSGSTADVECLASVSNMMEIKLSTGDIKVEDVTAGGLDLSVTTGDIKVSSVVCGGNIDVCVSTGRTELTDVSCKAVVSDGDTGHIILKDVIASELISVERSTGDVRFENSDAASISVKTSTGDVTGTLLSEKVFITETSTGDIRVPKTVAGGRCEITTSTGNIEINIQ